MTLVSWCFIDFCLGFSGFRKVDLHIYEKKSLFGVGEYVFNSSAVCIHECHQRFE